jgi:RNA polymerase sigma-70 factor (ECF subfamily)
MERRRDDELVTGFLAGDDACFAELIRRYQGPIVRMIEGITGDRGMAEDAAQETFLAVAFAMEGLDRPESFRSWLFRIAHRKGTLMAKRDRRRRAHVSIGEPAGREPAALERVEHESRIRERLRRILGTLPGRDRSILDLRFLEGFTHEEIAHVTGRSAGSIRTQLWRLKKALLERLRGPEEDLA